MFLRVSGNDLVGVGVLSCYYRQTDNDDILLDAHLQKTADLYLPVVQTWKAGQHQRL